MKTIILLIFMSMISLQMVAVSEDASFVATTVHTFICKDFKMGFASTRIMNSDGSKIRIPTTEIIAFRNNGRQFERMPLIRNSGDTVTYTFMEFICSRNGYRLYRYCTNCNHYDPLEDEIAPLNPVYRYYVLSNGRLKLIDGAMEFSKAMEYFKVKVNI